MLVSWKSIMEAHLLKASYFTINLKHSLVKLKEPFSQAKKSQNLITNLITKRLDSFIMKYKRFSVTVTLLQIM